MAYNNLIQLRSLLKQIVTFYDRFDRTDGRFIKLGFFTQSFQLFTHPKLKDYNINMYDDIVMQHKTTRIRMIAFRG